MFQKVRLKEWTIVLAENMSEHNYKFTYYKVYYPDNVRFGAVRRPYICYFGKEVWIQRRRKYGKYTLPDEYSAHTKNGVWLMNIHESWIGELTVISEEAVAEITEQVISSMPVPKKVEHVKPDFTSLSFEQLFEV